MQSQCHVTHRKVQTRCALSTRAVWPADIAKLLDKDIAPGDVLGRSSDQSVTQSIAEQLSKLLTADQVSLANRSWHYI